VIDPRYLRPTEVDDLQGNADKARARLGWAPRTGFSQLVGLMVDHDLELARKERMLRDSGHETSIPRGGGFDGAQR